jgi:ABC-type transporter Mla subunit MlaD
VPVSKTSSLLVVSVGSRMLLVGAAEGSLRLLSELDPADLEPVAAEASAALAPEAPRFRAFRATAARATAPVRSTDGPWTGFVRHLQRMTLRTAPGGPFRARTR